ncbi:MFS transporter [Trebonia kvetii]|uniref:MFS transporter n=1 Tax=Trebonia kvetii TaxID=2480626 RepID=A0A6P2BV08_9ACTN|nr:MFS transporter [Trebonia kvetii]TVZ02171.1 MFS transporter [Trebonia kvetii]
MTSSASPTAAPQVGGGGEARALPGARFALIVVSLLWPAQLLSLIGMMTGTAQASVALHFHTAQIAWFVLSTALLATLITPFAVKAADLYGKRQVMIVITALGLVGDVIAALAPSYGVLLAGRTIAGFYGPIAALAYATMREVLPPKQAASASGIVGSGIALVAIGGPFLTGWLIDGYSFHGVLWGIAASTAVSLVLLLVAVPRTPFRDPTARMDWVGGLLLGGGLTALTFGVDKGSDWGWTSAGTLCFIIVGAAAVVAFLYSQRIVPHPMVRVSMLARRPVWTVVLATALAGGAVYGASVITQLLVLYPKVVVPYPVGGGRTIPVHLSDGLGWTATHFAVVGVPSSILILLVGFGTGLAVRKVDSRLPIGAGALLLVAGFLLEAAFHYSATELILASLPYAMGLGMVVAAIPVLVIEAVTPEEQALGNGIQAMAMGMITTLVTTLCYVILAQHGKVLQGTLLYLDHGYKDAYYFGACVAAAGLLAVLLIPRLKAIGDISR